MVKLWGGAVFGLCSTLALGQGRDNLWMGGSEGFAPIPFGGSSINFVTGTADIYYNNRPIDLYYTAANISDAAGNLLFFSNGVVVGKADGDTMQNGTGLNQVTTRTIGTPQAFPYARAI
ncbi:MAG: hypothetical protein IPJ76_02810 [Flavobacteriales bacterium]|nr:MAG: hypothetical protein IPJ76_02810 [Flavobacteriales bacterium]